MNLTKSMMMFAAGTMLLPLAAQAETKPTIVVLHRNIQNQTDEKNWQNLALDLAGNGYRVVSVALEPTQSASSGRDEVVKLLNESPEPAVATLGPRTVDEPADLVGKVPSYQIKITDSKRPELPTELGASVIRVREEGHSTLAKRQDLSAAIVMVAADKRKA